MEVRRESSRGHGLQEHSERLRSDGAASSTESQEGSANLEAAAAASPSISTLSTAEWQAQHEEGGYVDLWVEEEFNSGSRLMVNPPPPLPFVPSGLAGRAHVHHSAVHEELRHACLFHPFLPGYLHLSNMTADSPIWVYCCSSLHKV